jgi:hypothetical protein
MNMLLDHTTRTSSSGNSCPRIISYGKANTFAIGGGVIVDKHGARRAPFRFSFKGLNCFK